jgi:hypothetical protein
LAYEYTQSFSFFIYQVFLLILVEQVQEVDMTSAFQIHVEEAISGSLAFTSNGIRASCVANPSEPRHEVTTNRIVEKIGLNEAEHIQSCRSSHPVQSLRENAGFDVYH